ncbi:Sporulation related domain-containing protein [Hyunsoonleella jejuensis]|uniref:Sporulation related domain-containing protein n=2 Tax=Hyunsoonleella jejuensis TaxID=419940 RepID=A0A1H9AFR0_9FLAO|nr:Sporulation related domain-containing protein [Hyunsoonleella jejuensis]
MTNVLVYVVYICISYLKTKTMYLKNSYLSLLLVVFLFGFGHSQEGKVTINQDERIPELLELKKQMNRDETSSRRYKIQVYSGNRNGAQNAQNDFSDTFGEWRPVMHYETPNFKVWAGNFSTRLEADRALKRIKLKFPSAFIFKPKKKN